MSTENTEALATLLFDYGIMLEARACAEYLSSHGVYAKGVSVADDLAHPLDEAKLDAVADAQTIGALTALLKRLADVAENYLSSDPDNWRHNQKASDLESAIYDARQVVEPL